MRTFPASQTYRRIMHNYFSAPRREQFSSQLGTATDLTRKKNERKSITLSRALEYQYYHA